MQYEHFSYIYPPRPETTIKFGSEIFHKYINNYQYVAQLKLNGQRNVIYIDPDGKQQWWNRHKELHRNYNPPEWLRQELHDLIVIEPGKWTVIDSELLHAKDASIKNTLYLYDLLVLNGEYLIGTTYESRFLALQQLLQLRDPVIERKMIKISPHIYIPQNMQGQQEITDAWELTKISWVEGFVFKLKSGTLKYGFSEKNNSDWMIKCRKPTNCYRQ